MTVSPHDFDRMLGKVPLSDPKSPAPEKAPKPPPFPLSAARRRPEDFRPQDQ